MACMPPQPSMALQPLTPLGTHPPSHAHPPRTNAPLALHSPQPCMPPQQHMPSPWAGMPPGYVPPWPHMPPRHVEGHIIDASDSDYRCDWNIGLYDIVSAASTNKVEKHGEMLWKGRSVSGKVSYGYCQFCSYASTNHRILNNLIRMHLRLSLACGMPDCWFITHSA